MRRRWCRVAVSVAAWAVACSAAAQFANASDLGVLELRFTPTRFAQLAIWVERDNGEFVGTLRLTEAVAMRGIGNRPGASEMNSGFRWPYGRREGVLPIWAARRAAAPGAKLWRRVIYQDRVGEGLTARTSEDFSPDDYFCLSLDRALSTRDALDAVSCASPFTSDKGRYITQADVDAGYAEPYEQPLTLQAFMRPLSLQSLYPPRRDVSACDEPGNGCFHHADVASFAAHAREVMPDIDAVTMATPVGGVAQQILYSIPAEWPAGAYRACVEINVEGDYNGVFNEQSHPSPLGPGKKGETWDAPFSGYGYPYRGQPSVVYCADFAVGGHFEQVSGTAAAQGSAGSWDLTDPVFGTLRGMDGVSDDPVAAPGSGADRLRMDEQGQRLELRVRPPCRGDLPPSAVSDLAVFSHPDPLHAHEWVRLRFAAAADDGGIVRYEVRVSNQPIIDETGFTMATRAKQATIEAAELIVPAAVPAGQAIVVDTGGLVERSHYYLAVRAIDACAGMGPIRSIELETPQRVFSTVTPCFVATAAFGHPLSREVGHLRRLRDRYLASNALGRLLVSAYWAWGPQVASTLAEHEMLRAVTRAALTPAVSFARWLEGTSGSRSEL
jgi:hypothetical protein